MTRPRISLQVAPDNLIKKMDDMNKLSPNMKFEMSLFLMQAAPMIFIKKIDDMNKLFLNMKESITRTQVTGRRSTTTSRAGPLSLARNTRRRVLEARRGLSCWPVQTMSQRTVLSSTVSWRL